MDPIEGPSRWSPEEDEMLLNHTLDHGNWSLIYNSMPGKSVKACSSRLSSLFGKDGVMDQTAGRWSPEEDEMLIKLVLEHGFRLLVIGNSIPGKSVETCLSRLLKLLGKDGVMDQTARRWSPEEDEMLINLILEHGSNWSLISKSIPGKSPAECWLRYWRSLAKNDQIERLWNSGEDEIDEDKIGMLPKLVEKHGPNSSPPVINISDHNIPSYEIPFNGDMAMETGSQNSIYERNSSHEVGDMVSGQPPSISDMARGNTSSEGTHSYSRDHSAPSWNALYKRDSSPMTIDSVQQLVGSEFGRNDFSEVSSTSGKERDGDK